MSDTTSTDTAVVVPAYVTAILRWVGTIAVGYLGKLGYEGESTAWIGAAVIGLGTLGWSLWQKRETAKRIAAAQKSRDPVAAAPAVPK